MQSKKLRGSYPTWDGVLEVAGELEHSFSEFSNNFTETCLQLNVWRCEMAILKSFFIN